MAHERTIWQIAAGESGRSYADKFLEHSIALIGPGWDGPWDAQKYKNRDGEFVVRRFATGPKEGDIVLLRSGSSRSEICAVGLFVGNYQYFKQFDDVNGWDLQHGWRVQWMEDKHDFRAPVFPRATFSKVWKNEPRVHAQRSVDALCQQTSPLPDNLPTWEPPIENVTDALRDIVDIGDLLPLHDFWGEYRKKYDAPPRERELVAHFLVPLLRKLGWSPECIGIEWKNVDITLFSKPSRSSEDLEFIIEAKQFGADKPIEGALYQAFHYLEKEGISKEVKVILTDGTRYYMYTGEGQLIAYANLANLKQNGIALFEKMKNPNKIP